jgi:hypothetical protein
MSGHDIVRGGLGERAEFAGQGAVKLGVTEGVNVACGIGNPMTVAVGGRRQEYVLGGRRRRVNPTESATRAFCG